MTPERRQIVERVAARLAEMSKDWNWIGARLGETAQTINNWKNERGIPSAKYAAVAKLIGWNVETLLGHAEASDDWPFPHIPASRFEGLSDGQLMQIEGVLMDKLAEIERGPPTKYPSAATERTANKNSRPGRNRKTAT